jgi:glycosyltransferase involved in cell wall biosynthesis
LRLAVVSPFLDRQHGTERCITEQLERIAAEPGVEVHLYSQRVDRLEVTPYPNRAAGRVIWHKVSRLPGPHLFGYLWWFLANHLQRWYDVWLRGLNFDVLYSAGINAVDADVISIHVVFAALYDQAKPTLRLRAAPVWQYPLLLHRRLYYLFIRALERIIYPAGRVSLSAISLRTADCVRERFGRDEVAVIRYGVDTRTFQPRSRLEQRARSRQDLGISDAEFCLLFIGNDWNNKGLPCLLKAIAALPELRLRLLVVGNDQRFSFANLRADERLNASITIQPTSPDVMQFYAAADAYVAPSLEDAYGLPILEAMACGLPVIASSRAGASEIIEHGVNGLILRDPQNASELAGLLREVYSDPALCQRLGQEARKTAEQQTWDRNAALTWELLQSVAARKKKERATG